MFQVIKKFAAAWFWTFVVLLIYSCIKYREQIAYHVSNNLWAGINGLMPPLIIFLGILYAIRSAFRK